jgi:hypothetical protein
MALYMRFIVKENSMDRTGFIKTHFESIEQATRVLNATGYTDSLVIRENGLYSTNRGEYLSIENIGIHESHRTTSKQSLVRVLFAFTEDRKPLGTLSIACGAEHADAITKVSDLLSYFKLENQ